MITAVALNLAVAAVCVVVGVRYLAAGGITSYHETAIGVEWSSLAPGVQTMLLVLMKGTGDALLVTGIGVAILTWIPLRQQQSWARGAILAVGLACLLPMLAGAVYVAATTGASSPWWLNAALSAALLVAFALSRSAPPDARS